MSKMVAVIMGSDPDFPVVKGCVKTLKSFGVPVEVRVLSAHRTPDEVTAFAKSARGRGIKVIIAAAGMAAHLPGVIAAQTTVPVIGVPVKSTFEGLDALLAIVQMPPGIPVATVGVNAAENSAISAAEMLALADDRLAARLDAYKFVLAQKISKANEDLERISYKFKV